MQRVARQNQPLLQFPAPSVLDVFQIAMFGRTVNFVTQDGMSQVRQMHAYLVHASRFRNAPDQRQGPGVFHVRSFRKTVVHAFPAGCTACLTHMRLSATSPCLKMGAVHAVSVHSGHSCTIARYSLCIRRRCMALPSSLAALLCLATSVRPLVSLSSLLTRERAAPLAIS